jgi:putative SOS response-associated peptidase YedK
LAKSLKAAHYNAAPSQQLPVVTNELPDAIQFFSWGLQSFWAKDAKAVKRAINARAETLAEKLPSKSC